MLSGKKITAMLGAATAAISVAFVADAGVSAAVAADPIKLEVSGEATAVAGIVDGDNINADARADLDAEIEVKASTVLDNGMEVGAVLEPRLDGQQAAQSPAGGRYTGLLIGGPRGVAPLRSDAYLQGAYAYARGGFGEVLLGREQGVARKFAVTAPTIFRSINVNDWRSDLTGLNDVHTVNDFSGYATRISYMPPANFLGGVVGGLQLGVSYAPTLRDCGEALCAPEQGFLVAPDGSLLNENANWDDVLEAALYYQTRLSSDILIGLGASYVSADEDARSVSQIFDDYEAYSLGLNFAYRGVTIGGSIKSTNAGLAGAGGFDDGYLAFDAGVTFMTGDERGDWGFMLGYGQSEASVFGPNPLDPSLFQDTQTAQAGVTYFIGRGVTIGAAGQFVESTKPEAAGGPEEAAAFVIESSIRF